MASEVPIIEEIASGDVGMRMPLVVLFLIAGCVSAFFYWQQKQQQKKQKELDDQKKKKESEAPMNVSNTVSLKDIAYLADQLGPNSTHIDVLWAVASTPESIEWGLQNYNAQEIIREERRQQDEEESKNPDSKKKKAAAVNLFDLAEDGWADDYDDEEQDEEAKRKIKLAKDTEEQEKSDRENLQKDSGKIRPLLEGLDEGVIGQTWVETTLASVKAWPPKDLKFFGKRTFEYNGKQVSSPLDHPGLRRNICMITGRLHSIVLNSHPELCKFESVHRRGYLLLLLLWKKSIMTTMLEILAHSIYYCIFLCSFSIFEFVDACIIYLPCCYCGSGSWFQKIGRSIVF
jgi:hypothetical protein